MPAPLPHRAGVGNAERPEQQLLGTSGACDDAIGTVQAARAARRVRERAQRVVAHEAVADRRRGAWLARTDRPHVVGAALDVHRHVRAGGECGERRGHERLLVERAQRRLRDDARGRHEQVVAAAGVDRVERQRRAVVVERHAPHHAVEPAGEDVAGPGGRALRKPDRVDELQPHPAREARVGGAHEHHRCRRRRRESVRAEHRPADPVVRAARVDDERRCVHREQPVELAIREVRNGQRIPARLREQVRGLGGRQRWHRRRGGWRIHDGRRRDRCRGGGEGVAHRLLVEAHTRREADPRERVPADGAGDVVVLVRHLRPRDQIGAQRGRRGGCIGQRATAAFEQRLRRQRAEAFGVERGTNRARRRVRQVGDLDHAGGTVLVLEQRAPLREGARIVGRIGQRRAEGRGEARDAQRRCAGNARGLCVAHAGGIDRRIERRIGTCASRGERAVRGIRKRWRGEVRAGGRDQRREARDRGADGAFEEHRCSGAER